MKKNAKADLRAKSVDELKKEIVELRGTMLKARFAQSLEGKAMGVKYRNLRRQIARLNTIITQKQKAAP